MGIVRAAISLSQKFNCGVSISSVEGDLYLIVYLKDDEWTSGTEFEGFKVIMRREPTSRMF